MSERPRKPALGLSGLCVYDAAEVDELEIMDAYESYVDDGETYIAELEDKNRELRDFQWRHMHQSKVDIDPYEHEEMRRRLTEAERLIEMVVQEGGETTVDWMDESNAFLNGVSAKTEEAKR